MNFTRKPLDEVLVNDAIRGCEKGENVRNKVALVFVKPVLPVVEILGEIYLLGGPERRLRLFVHLPNLFNLLVTWPTTLEKPEKACGTYFVVLNREEDKATLRFFEKRLVLLVEFDVANETLAGVIDILLLSSND